MHPRFLSFLVVCISPFLHHNYSIGISGYDDCPFSSDRIVIYLIAGGLVLGAVVILRIVPSLTTICKNRNYFRTRESAKCAGCICACETFFFLLFIGNLIALVLGTFAVFEEKPDDDCPESDPDCDDFCSSGVYILSSVYVVLQYVLYAFSAMYLFLVLCCNRSLRSD